jgi:hypothetical protein
MTTPSIPIRHSHLFNYCAVGAIIKTPDCLIVPMDTRYWVDKKGIPFGKEILFVELTRQQLGIFKRLIQPPVSKRLGNLSDYDVTLPAVRFPGWMRCWRCDALYRYPHWKNYQKPQCERCKTRPRLEQVHWVLIHEDGHMDDIPWYWLAHKEPKYKTCRDHNSLSLIKSKTSMEWELKCICGARFSFTENKLKESHGVFFHNVLMNQQPWIRQHADYNKNKNPIAVEIGNAKIYFPLKVDALVIPPESRIQTDSLTAKLYSLRGELEKLHKYKKIKPLFDNQIRIIAGVFGASPDEIYNAWLEIQNGFPYFGNVTHTTPGILSEQEYQALITPIADLRENEAFVTQHLTDAWLQRKTEYQSTGVSPIIQAIDRLIAVHRLKVIWVYKGFSRVFSSIENTIDNQYNLVPPDLENKQDWLPALELFGEGVFITLAESVIAEWEKLEGVNNRLKATQSRLKYSRNPSLPGSVTPRFVLLHTLAHLMIRQIEFSCGYPAASLKERLYAQSPSEDLSPMAGILIYVAVPDKVGSLGGLVEIAEPGRFLDLMVKVFNQAAWCSFDPVCSEHEGHGPDLLNRAACHACALIPETACEYGNALLDRVLISGELKQKDGIPPLLDFIKIWATREQHTQSS